MQERLQMSYSDVGSAEVRDIARQLVEKALFSSKMTVIYFPLNQEAKFLLQGLP